jgi:hypothetical protein
MSPPMSNIMIPTQKTALSEPCWKELSHCCTKRNALSSFMKAVSRKRPLKVLRTKASFITQNTSTTESPDTISVISKEERSVHFDVTKPDTVHFILSRHDYTAEEKEVVWFQHEEFAWMTKENRKQVRKMENGEDLNDKEYCSRGLGSHTRQSAISKLQNRKLAVEAVLNEQHEQELDAPNEEAISHASCQVTSSCKLWARMIGLQDQRWVEQECMY